MFDAKKLQTNVDELREAEELGRKIAVEMDTMAEGIDPTEAGAELKKKMEEGAQDLFDPAVQCGKAANELEDAMASNDKDAIKEAVKKSKECLANVKDATDKINEWIGVIDIEKDFPEKTDDEEFVGTIDAIRTTAGNFSASIEEKDSGFTAIAQELEAE